MTAQKNHKCEQFLSEWVNAQNVFHRPSLTYSVLSWPFSGTALLSEPVENSFFLRPIDLKITFKMDFLKNLYDKMKDWQQKNLDKNIG